MEGLERLEAEVLEMNDCSVSAIFEYLKTRTDLYESFNNKEKSIKQMYSFICDKARKMSKNNVAMVQDNLVYMWAVTYFSKSNEELGINKKPTPISKPTEKKTETKKDDEKKPKDNQITLFQEVQE